MHRLRGWPLLLILFSSVPARAGADELWAGHQILIGHRKLPILGLLETRTESFHLARVERHGDRLLLHQRTCRMEVAPVAGVHVRFLPEGVLRMPPSLIPYARRGERWEGGPWITEWGEEDVDGDGNPGATLVVEAPICGGTLHVGGASHASTKATEKSGGLEGEMRATVRHRLLGASSGCLRLAARDSEETVAGTFAYVPVPADATCESLLAGSWPVRAPEPLSTRPASSRRPTPRLR